MLCWICVADTGSNFGSIFYDSVERTISLFFTFGDSVGESEVSMLIISSKDEGATWSDRASVRNISASVQASGAIRVFFGMVNGIELLPSNHQQEQQEQGRGVTVTTAGAASPGHRLVIPGWVLLNKKGVTGKYDVSGSALMYSDDHGLTWEVGEVLTKGAMGIEDTEPSESTVVELTNGSLLVNIRDSLNVLDRKEGKERCGCRLIGRSDTRGATWASLWQEPDLISSGVEGSMTATPAAPAAQRSQSEQQQQGQGQTLWFSNPRSKTGRVNGTVYYSNAEGALGSWVEAGRVPGEIWHAAAGRPIDTFNFGYNMVVPLPQQQQGQQQGQHQQGQGQMFGVLYQNGWVGNAGTHYSFYCNDPCCEPSSEHPETKLCGVLFARFELQGPTTS
eukprot:COSAG06_NODE_94_length_24612_cov_12.885041_11_plen_392_part_00